MSDVIINDVYEPYLDCLSRVQIFYGGSGSGKSVFLAQRSVLDLIRGGRNYLICRQVARTVRRSVMNEIIKAIDSMDLRKQFQVNKSEAIITCANGYQILFAGLDDVEKIKSITPAKGVLTDIFVEEATEASSNTVKDLEKRQRGGESNVPKRITMSFNPIMRNHWIFENYFKSIGWTDDQTEHKSDELSILKTWYIHNKFLTDADRADLLNEKDSYYRDVYAFGNWGVLGGVIFKNWCVEDLSKMRDQFTNTRHGLDFGFSSHPSALVATHYDRERKIIYIYDELYETGMTNDVLAKAVKEIIGSDYVTCDSAEPKSIAEITQRGITAKSAAKGKDSILHGVQWLQQQTIVIDKSCINTQNEFQQYKWMQDKNGEGMQKPLDKNNHAIDALRYAYERESTRSAVQVSW